MDALCHSKSLQSKVSACEGFDARTTCVALLLTDMHTDHPWSRITNTYPGYCIRSRYRVDMRHTERQSHKGPGLGTISRFWTCFPHFSGDPPRLLARLRLIRVSKRVVLHPLRRQLRLHNTLHVPEVRAAVPTLDSSSAPGLHSSL